MVRPELFPGAARLCYSRCSGFRRKQIDSPEPLRSLERCVLERATGMRDARRESASSMDLLLAYVADLELEVDRLRKQGQLVRHEVRDTLKRIQLLCAEPPAEDDSRLTEIHQAARQLAEILRDLQE